MGGKSRLAGVVAEGLGNRYANPQLNGARLPTADPDRRAVPFALFPSSSSIQRVSVVR